jgi:hypothetical protein
MIILLLVGHFGFALLTNKPLDFFAKALVKVCLAIVEKWPRQQGILLHPYIDIY